MQQAAGELGVKRVTANGARGDAAHCGGDGEPVQQHFVERAGRAGAFQPHRADLLLIECDRRRDGRGQRRGGRLPAIGRHTDRPARAVEPDPGHALGQTRRGSGERREIHPSAHQGVVEHDDADRAFDVRIQVRQP
ncbi:hypothetical protein [Streptomyces sp. NPDC005408]|uniref:hypothetical protein n=1 Tax=Streptomyces sp. NPDC005408 TaxID=3155341 RepID=UPI0033AFE541